MTITETPALPDDWPAMPAEERTAVFRGLPHGAAESVFAQLSSADQADLLVRLPPAERRIWARTLAPDDAADCVQAAPPAVREELLDCLDDLDEIPICLGYRLDGKPVSDLPALAEDVARLEPEYEKLPGWKATTTGATRYEELPSAAQRYVRALEDAVGAPAVLISTGPRREETIWRGDTAFLSALPQPK